VIPLWVRVAQPRPARVLLPRPPSPASGVAGGEKDFQSRARFPGRSWSWSANNTLAVILAIGIWSALSVVAGARNHVPMRRMVFVASAGFMLLTIATVVQVRRPRRRPGCGRPPTAEGSPPRLTGPGARRRIQRNGQGGASRSAAWRRLA
jgi:hypothetical protein